MRLSLGFLLIYIAAMALGGLFTLDATGLALFWPAAGVGMLWLARGGTRAAVVADAVVLFVVTTAYFATVVGSGPTASVLVGVASVLQGLVSRLALARLSDRPYFGTLDFLITDFTAVRNLVLATVAAAVAGAPVGVLATWAETGDLTWTTGLDWALQTSCGILVPTVAALAFVGGSREVPVGRMRERLTAEPRSGAALELTAALALTVGLGFVVLAEPGQVPLAFVMMGTAAWVGFRFSPAVGGLYTLVFGTLAILLTLGGRGPFGAVEDELVRANAIQLFVTMTALMVLLLACGVSDRAKLAARLRAVEAAARQRGELLNAVNGVLVDGLCVSDSWGHVILANPAASEFGGANEFGVHVHDAPDTRWFWPDGNAIDPEDLPHARALRGEVVELLDVVRRDTGTGQEKVLSVSAVPLHYNSAGSDVTSETGPLAVVLMRDVTQQRAQQRAQADFVSVVAHDLKAPLTGVLSWAEITLDQLDPDAVVDAEAARTGVARIQRTATRMSRLISDLLDYTAAGSSPLHLTTIDLDELVDSVVADLERPDSASVISHPPLGSVISDELLTRQLFANLISNAIKFVAPGVTPRVRIESRMLQGAMEIQVSDNGVGIPEGDRSRIFDSFYRASTTRDQPGSGLGLAICLHAVERHGGRIVAREGPGGEGTTIVFTLPLADSSPGAAPESDPTAQATTPYQTSLRSEG